MPPFNELPLRVLSPYFLCVSLRAISTDVLEHSRLPGSGPVDHHRGGNRPNDQRAQNISGKLPLQHQEPPHHVLTNDHDDNVRPVVRFDHQTVHPEGEPGAITRLLMPQEMVENKSSTGLDVRSAITRHQEGTAGRSLDNAVKERTMWHQEELAGRSLARGVREGFAMKAAPAYDDAIRHAGNHGKREKLR